jgi:hypothetical protein
MEQKKIIFNINQTENSGNGPEFFCLKKLPQSKAAGVEDLSLVYNTLLQAKGLTFHPEFRKR